MPITYTSLGFVNTGAMFVGAMRGGYAVPAYNFNNMEQLQAIVMACLDTQSPVILQVSKGARDYADRTLLTRMGQGAVEMMKRVAGERGVGEIPIALHLDHGDSVALCVSCIDTGFSSVMIDGSHLASADNVAVTQAVVACAHPRGVTVEGELGILAGVEDEVAAGEHTYTSPDEVEEFVERTGVDSLAISIGTSHGAYKFKAGQKPEIRLDILHEIERRIPGFPIVLHGSSSIPPDAVAAINRYGGRMKDSIGIPESQLREAARSSVCKINIDSDGRIVMTAKLREILALNPQEFDPRKYLGPAREALLAMYREKNHSVLGSAGRAPEIMREISDGCRL